MLLDTLSRIDKPELEIPINDEKEAAAKRLRYYSFLRVVTSRSEKAILRRMDVAVHQEKLTLIKRARRYKGTITPEGNLKFIDRDLADTPLTDFLLSAMMESETQSKNIPQYKPKVDAEDMVSKLYGKNAFNIKSPNPTTSDQSSTAPEPTDIPPNPMEE